MKTTIRMLVAMLLASGLVPALAGNPEPQFVLPKRDGANAAPAPTMIRRIRFRGNTVFSNAELDQLAAPYRGRVLGEADREQLRLEVTEHYIGAGYLNSGALLGPIEGEQLTIEIVEGRLSAIRLSGMERLRDPYLLQRMAGDPAAPFNMDALRERFTLLLQDPLFERLNARLVPGAAPGQAILDVDVTRARPYRLSAYVNNYRPPSIGANAVGLKGTIRNLTAWAWRQQRATNAVRAVVSAGAYL